MLVASYIIPCYRILSYGLFHQQKKNQNDNGITKTYTNFLPLYNFLENIFVDRFITRVFKSVFIPNADSFYESYVNFYKP